MTGAEVRQEIGRLGTARDRVLAALLAAGPDGCTNVELCAPHVGGMRFGARLFELKHQLGWDISDPVHERGGVYRYICHGRKEPRQQALWGAA